MVDLTIERLVPHRERMRLIDTVLAVDEHQAVTASVVTPRWPMASGEAANALLIIELVAQTASIHIGWFELQKDPDSQGGRGWLVGIKSADFHIPQIPVEARVVTEVKPEYQFESYTGILGRVHMGPQLIGEVRLQVMRSESDSVLKAAANPPK